MNIKESIEFLKQLQTEMKTQETDCQASTRFWVVAENKREYGFSDDYSDGTVVCDCEGNEFETVNEFIKFLIENGSLVDDSSFDENSDFEDVLNTIKNDMGYNIVGYRNINDVIAPNTFFLTKNECKEHIRLNHYHYQQPHTYAMTVWRSPQVERLYSIIENFDWDAIERLLEKQTSKKSPTNKSSYDGFPEENWHPTYM